MKFKTVICFSIPTHGPEAKGEEGPTAARHPQGSQQLRWTDESLVHTAKYKGHNTKTKYFDKSKSQLGQKRVGAQAQPSQLLGARSSPQGLERPTHSPRDKLMDISWK